MASIIKGNKPSERECNKIKRLQKEWLKKNKPKKCPDMYLDNPYKQSIYGKAVANDSSVGN